MTVFLTEEEKQAYPISPEFVGESQDTWVAEWMAEREQAKVSLPEVKWTSGNVMTPGFATVETDDFYVIEYEAEFLRKHIKNRGPMWTLKVDEDPIKRLDRILKEVKRLRNVRS